MPIITSHKIAHNIFVLSLLDGLERKAKTPNIKSLALLNAIGNIKYYFPLDISSRTICKTKYG